MCCIVIATTAISLNGMPFSFGCSAAWLFQRNKKKLRIKQFSCSLKHKQKISTEKNINLRCTPKNVKSKLFFRHGNLKRSLNFSKQRKLRIIFGTIFLFLFNFAHAEPKIVAEKKKHRNFPLKKRVKNRKINQKFSCAASKVWNMSWDNEDVQSFWNLREFEWVQARIVKQTPAVVYV